MDQGCGYGSAWRGKWAADPRVNLSNLGPHPVENITSAVRGHLVDKMGIPVIVHDGAGSYAVLVPKCKMTRVICVGCYDLASPWDRTRMMDWNHRCECDTLLADRAANTENGVTDDDFIPDDVERNYLERVETETLVDELSTRDDYDPVATFPFFMNLEEVDTEVLIDELCSRNGGLMKEAMKKLMTGGDAEAKDEEVTSGLASDVKRLGNVVGDLLDENRKLAVMMEKNMNVVKALLKREPYETRSKKTRR